MTQRESQGNDVAAGRLGPFYMWAHELHSSGWGLAWCFSAALRFYADVTCDNVRAFRMRVCHSRPQTNRVLPIVMRRPEEGNQKAGHRACELLHGN